MQEVVPGFGRPFGVYGYLSITSSLLENVAYFEDGSTRLSNANNQNVLYKED